MKKEIKTRQQLIERLNEIDRRCIDSNRHFHDLRTLFEAKEYKLSAQDKADIKKVASIEDDPDTLKAYIDSKAIEEDFEQDWDPEDYAGGYTEWDLIDSKRTAGGESYNLWYNEFNDKWVCTSGDSDIYYPENAPEYDAEFEDEGEAREWFEDCTGEGYDEEDLELVTDDMNGGQWLESLKEEINLNDYDDSYVELRDGKPQFVYSTLRDAKDGMFWSQMGDNEHDLGKHSYEIKKWENGELKDLNESVEESFLPSTGIGWFDKMYRELSDSERAQMNHVIKNIFYVKDDELPSIDEDTLDRIVDKFLDTTIDESYEDGEYDYFVVYKGETLQGEYPTYEEAKKNAGEGCTIKGVIQYGGSEYEETNLTEESQIANKPGIIKKHKDYIKVTDLGDCSYHWFDNKEYNKDLKAAKPDKVPKGKKLMRDPFAGWVYVDDKEAD